MTWDALSAEPYAAKHAAALAELFERSGSGCHCQYWHFTGDKNAWLARLAFEPGANRSALEQRARDETLAGVVARRGARVVGWMKLEPAQALPKLYEQRIYRDLPCLQGVRDRVWVVGCFLVDPEERRRGVARALLRTGIELARTRGGTALEAFPRRANDVGDEMLWTGPLLLLETEGFEVVHEQAQYPVMRKLL